VRNLVILSDGTGNSAAALSKTNVWRLYEALDLSDGSQVATFGDGVGTSRFKPLQLLGRALGIGVKRNVVRLYKFLCRNYSDGDQIWCFGFSRGAFTVRALAGLIYHEGLIRFESEEELDRNAVNAYRAYRKKAFRTKLTWVIVGRWVRDEFIHLWRKLWGKPQYDQIKKRDSNRIHFLGVWDTVVAYGLPVDELTQAVDKWVWPMKFRDTSLLDNVTYARQALSIDDERRTFFPIPWNETKTRCRDRGNWPDDRLLQVWFVGVHANVGGGYPDDSLAYVPLCWMIEETINKGLRFRPEFVSQLVGYASSNGRIYDSRAGFGAFYRYQPRDAKALMGKGNRPIIHHSVVTRMALGSDGYAPISLPYDIDIVPQYGPVVPFNAAQAASMLSPPNSNRLPPPPPRDRMLLPGTTARILRENKKRLLESIIKLDTANAPRDRAPIVDLVLDTVWWRRVLYFVSLFLALFIVVYPLFASRIHIPLPGDAPAREVVRQIVDPIQGLLPGYAEPWIAALRDKPVVVLGTVMLLASSFWLSRFLQRRILDRSRAAWRVEARGKERHPGKPPIDVNHPGIFLSIARSFRTSCVALAVYRWFARVALPAIFLLVCIMAVLAWAYHVSFALFDTAGVFCRTDNLPPKSDNSPSAREFNGKEVVLDTKSLCQATGLRLVEGRRYRITMTVADDWFDKAYWTDVRGLTTTHFEHYLAFPLKRWWTKNWLQPIARVGSAGNFEYPLEAESPLPEMPPYRCPSSGERMTFTEAIRTISVPATNEERAFVKACVEKTLKPEQTLIADIVPRNSGELFLYLNDAVLIWPGKTNLFYLNNSGSAKVTVTPVLADAIVSDVFRK
jgi:uncharacterized protein (DUF2235 family)